MIITKGLGEGSVLIITKGLGEGTAIAVPPAFVPNIVRADTDEVISVVRASEPTDPLGEDVA